MNEQRFMIWSGVVGRVPRIRIIRTDGGRVFAMSVDEARTLIKMLESAVEQVQTRQSTGGRGAPWRVSAS